MLRYTILLISVSILFTACATKTTQEGMKTREIDISWKNSCIFIENAQTSSAIKLGANNNRLTVLNNIKNKTAEKGGNSYVINDFSSDGMGHFSGTFEIYKCPITKYNLPTKYKNLEKLKELLDKAIITKKEYDNEKKMILNNQ